LFRIIDFTLSNCLHSALSRVSLLTQYRYEELHGYIRQAWSPIWNSTSHRKEDMLCLPPASGKRYRGTADAVFQNLPIIRSGEPEVVLILSGDHVYDMDYRDLLLRHAETDADLTIATVEYPLKDASHFGVVQVDNAFRVIGFAEKPLRPMPLASRPTMALVSMGVYVFKAEVLIRALSDRCNAGLGHDFGHDIIPSLISSNRVFAYDFRDENADSPAYWRDIGTIDSYYQASMDLIQQDPPFDPDFTRYPAAGEKSTPRIHSRSWVSQSVVSAGVHIEDGAEIEHSILMPGAVVGKGVCLRRTIVEERVEIPAGFRAGFDLENDRLHYTVTDARVVVIGRTTHLTKKAAAGTSDRHSQIRISGVEQLEAEY
jgi:glucose-1-phosphate adenylyltransferase